MAPPSNRNHQESRRTVLKASGAASVASVLGLSGTAAAQEGDNRPSINAWMFNDEVRPGAIFRVESPPLENVPDLQGKAGQTLENATARVVQYFNTGEEVFLFLPQDSQVEQGTLFQVQEGFSLVDGGNAEGLAQIQIRRLVNQDLAFDLDEQDLEILGEGGGEGAVRPRNFAAGALLRVTSGPQGWVPQDVDDSGYFTDYNTRHATYLGTDDEFLIFPQEGAEMETDAVYIVRDEFEFLGPEGNVVAVEFDQVNEESIPVDDEFL